MLRIMTWNLHCGGQTAEDLTRRLPLIAEVIRRRDADVVAVQEATRREWLVQQIPGEFELGAVEHGFSLAIFSKVGRQYGHVYHGVPGHLPLVRLSVPYDGDTLDVYTVHLHAGGRPEDADERCDQLKAVLHAMRLRSSQTYLLAGDFNLYADEPGYHSLIAAGLTDCFRHLHPQDPGATYPKLHPPQRFDYVFASPKLAGRLQSCVVVTDDTAAQASDHFPLVAEFR